MHHPSLRSFLLASLIAPLGSALLPSLVDAHHGDPARTASAAAASLAAPAINAPAIAAPIADPFVLPAGDIEITDVVARAAAYLGCNVLVQKGTLPAAGQAPMTLQRGLTTDRAGCEEFLATALAHYGLTLTYADRKQTTLEALHGNSPNADRALQRATPRTVDEVLARPDLAMPATVVVDVAHCSLGEALSAMQPFVARSKAIGIGLTVGRLGDSNRLILLGLQTELAQALAVLRSVDRPEAATEAVRRERDREIEQLQRRIDGLERTQKAASKAGEAK
ncbi:MAG: hypothetical protein FJ306_03945 [Planctomycetes bacterium]|nr:hypothetical protein [Planctomycetota bacterium]